MARVSSFYEIRDRDGRAHPTSVDCGYLILAGSGRGTLLQLDTGGSKGRKFEGKTSQTLQLDETAASELIRIIKKAFPAVRV